MKSRDAVLLLVLSAIWGGSFLFMKLAVPAFGPVPLVFVRTFVSCVFLFPLVWHGAYWKDLRRHAGWLLLVGCLNSGIPFCLLAFSTLHLEAGFVSLLNAATPLFTALVAAAWFHVPLRPVMVAGLLIGISGVALVSRDRISFRPGGTGWAVVAALGATVCYALSANLAKSRLAGLPPLATCWGSMAGASLFLVIPAAVSWPVVLPATGAWGAALTLALLCTTAAYLLFYHLIRVAGATAVTSVTFLVPVFALLFAAVWLKERITLTMMQGMVVTMLGTSLVTGLYRRRPRVIAV